MDPEAHHHYQQRDEPDHVYTRELEHVSRRQAADLEMSLAAGYGIDQNGHKFRDRRFWHPVAVAPVRSVQPALCL